MTASAIKPSPRPARSFGAGERAPPDSPFRYPGARPRPPWQGIFPGLARRAPPAVFDGRRLIFSPRGFSTTCTSDLLPRLPTVQPVVRG